MLTCLSNHFVLVYFNFFVPHLYLYLYTIFVIKLEISTACTDLEAKIVRSGYTWLSVLTVYVPLNLPQPRIYLYSKTLSCHRQQLVKPCYYFRLVVTFTSDGRSASLLPNLLLHKSEQRD